MGRAELADVEVRLLCEVQLLPDTYLEAREQMHEVYIVDRASIHSTVRQTASVGYFISCFDRRSSITGRLFMRSIF